MWPFNRNKKCNHKLVKFMNNEVIICNREKHNPYDKGNPHVGNNGKFRAIWADEKPSGVFVHDFSQV